LTELAKNAKANVARLPYSLRVLLENLLRLEDGTAIQKKDIEAILNWNPKAEPDTEIQFTPARVLLQDFTGVPAVADLAAMRGALERMGGKAERINPLQPVALVIDHSVQVDVYGSGKALDENTRLEFERNRERYLFLKWGQKAFENFRVVPPGTGICHQVNLEYIAQVAWTAKSDGKDWVYPDTLVGTDSHTTMINGLGVVGWGVGGIEAEAAMLGQPITMLIPQVVGFKLTGQLAPGATATDLVLTVTQMLRKKGVVGKFVEFYGPGVGQLALADRATIANMAPEYGATIGYFPVDAQTTDYLELTNRKEAAKRTEEYYKAQGLWFSANNPEPEYSDTLELDLSKVEPCLAGPARPQDRVVLGKVPEEFSKTVNGAKAPTPVNDPSGQKYDLDHGSVTIAAITSCTNTSNPSVLIAAGLLAKKAAEKGLKPKPWVKTSLAPGSQVVTAYLKESGLLPYLEQVGFHVVGYGCTTCIGNSGPLPEHLVEAINKGSLSVAGVLSGNRNFEGRINPHVRANYLASPPLVVAYALAGSVNVDLTKQPIGNDSKGNPVFLKDIWPTTEEIHSLIRKHVTAAQFQNSYRDVFSGPQQWQKLEEPKGKLYAWEDDSTYIKEPPFFQDMALKPAPVQDIRAARVLGMFGDSVTTDHISPAGSIAKDGPAGQYLIQNGVKPADFNSYGARRGNHEVMIRGTFANIRIKNHLVPGVEGGVTIHHPTTQRMSIYDAAVKYEREGTPLVVLAGKEYGTGSSRDWAAKGTRLLGIRAVIAESFERIHRSNLIGMGVLPLQFEAGQSWKSLELTGQEYFDLEGLSSLRPGQKLTVKVRSGDGKSSQFTALVRIDTPNELEYYKHGGILNYVLREIHARG
ncbi:MAG TPA: aconitate hydratase AcnA, partial [Bdellovibrionales bacterium]|nr:aconitate hydratase AcnA [Bdellovibrionales bacterium]